MPAQGRTSHPAAGPATHLAIGLAALVLIALGIAAGPGWFDRHFLPSFGQTRAFQWGMVQAFRLLLGAAGLVLLLWVRPWALRAIGRGAGRDALISFLSIVLAVAASVTATELILRARTWRATQENAPRKEPERRPDALLGWDLAPGRTRRVEIDGRAIDYATDALGNRAASPAHRIDFERPTVLLAGESIMFGYGLGWNDTIAARLEAALGVQVANLAVPAYGTDQAYVRLRRELPRFARPMAVVILFTPFLLDRNLDRDRPHLDARLRWHAAEPPPLRLVELGRRLVRYRGEAAIAEGVAMTQNALRAATAAARARGAEAIIVVPQFLPEDPSERAVRNRVLDAAHSPYLLVPLDPRWRLSVDRHPDPHGAAAIAAALSLRLRHLASPRPAR